MEDIKDRFPSDFGWYSISKAVPTFVGILSLSLLTRVFSSAEYGIYTIILASVAISRTVIFGWVEQATLRYEPKSNSEATVSKITTITLIISILTLLTGAIGYLLFQFFFAEYQIFFVVAVVLLVAEGSFWITRAIYQSQLNPKKVSLLNSGHALLKFIFAAIILFGIYRNIISWLIGTVIGTILILGISIRDLPSLLKTDIEKNFVKQISSFGLPVIGWLLGLTLLEFIDRILLSILEGNAAVGAYSAHYAVANQGMLLVLTPAIQAAHPIIVNTWESDNNIEYANKQIMKMTRYVLLLGVPAAVGLAAVGDPVSRILLGEGFEVSPLVIPLIAVGILLWNTAVIGHKPLEIEEKTKLMMVGVIIAVLVNTFLNYILIPIYGPLGAAIATFVSFASYPLFIYIVPSKNGFNWILPIRSISNTLFASLIMILPYIVLFYIGQYPTVIPFFLIPISVVLYFSSLYVLNEFTQKEFTSIMNILRT